MFSEEGSAFNTSLKPYTQCVKLTVTVKVKFKSLLSVAQTCLACSIQTKGNASGKYYNNKKSNERFNSDNLTVMFFYHSKCRPVLYVYLQISQHVNSKYENRHKVLEKIILLDLFIHDHTD